MISKTWGNNAFKTLRLRQRMFSRCFLHLSLLFLSCFYVISSLFPRSGTSKKEIMWKQALFPHMCLHLNYTTWVNSFFFINTIFWYSHSIFLRNTQRGFPQKGVTFWNWSRYKLSKNHSSNKEHLFDNYLLFTNTF